MKQCSICEECPDEALLLGTVAQTSDIEVSEEGSEEEWAYMRVATTHGHALRVSGGRTEMVVRLLPPPRLTFLMLKP